MTMCGDLTNPRILEHADPVHRRVFVGGRTIWHIGQDERIHGAATA